MGQVAAVVGAPAAFLGAAAFAQGVLQGLSSDDPVRFGALPARLRYRLRLVPIQRSHHADARHHRWPVMLCHENQRLHRGLPLSGIVFGFGQLNDVERCGCGMSASDAVDGSSTGT